MTTSPTAIRYCRSAFVTIAALGLLSTPAFAGECPADKVVDNGHTDTAVAAQGVMDDVIGMVDLAQEAVKLNDHKFRLRQLTIEPGGIVPWHSHADRPAIIYVVSGEIVEYRNTCATPIVHKAGEVASETHTVAHWWKNEASEAVVLLSADILKHSSQPGTM